MQVLSVAHKNYILWLWRLDILNRYHLTKQLCLLLSQQAATSIEKWAAKIQTICKQDICRNEWLNLLLLDFDKVLVIHLVVWLIVYIYKKVYLASLVKLHLISLPTEWKVNWFLYAPDKYDCHKNFFVFQELHQKFDGRKFTQSWRLFKSVTFSQCTLKHGSLVCLMW